MKSAKSGNSTRNWVRRLWTTVGWVLERTIFIASNIISKIIAALQNTAKPERVIFLDRDGVLNIDKYVTYRIDQLELIAGVENGLSLLQDLGFEFIIVTNQSGIGKGSFTTREMQRFNQELIGKLKDKHIHILDLFHCPHDKAARKIRYRRDCKCHKPNPGMLFKAARKYSLDLSRCYLIGDKMSDVQAGLNAGCRTILVETGILDDEDQPQYRKTSPRLRVADLPRAARAIAGEMALEKMIETENYAPPFDQTICSKLVGKE
jgi:D,D-heptose 1,7-bisphosphate phosphatase